MKLVAVIGSGSIGSRHARNLRSLLPNATILVVDPDVAQATKLAAEISGTVEPSLAAALAQKPWLTVVATPPASHVSIAAVAARAGSHLFIEKPLSDTLDGIADLEHLIADRKLVVLVGCNMRFHPGYQAAADALASGKLGRLLWARFEGGQFLPDWHPMEDYRRGYSARRDLGGGACLDNIHEIDIATWLCGPAVELAAAVTRTGSLEIETEDLVSLIFRTEAGVQCEVHLDYLYRPYRRGCVLSGTLGSFEWRYGEPDTHLWTKPDGWVRTPLPPFDVNDMYVAELRHLLGCIDSREPVMLDLAGAARCLSLALAARRAAEERRWVTPHGIG